MYCELYDDIITSFNTVVAPSFLTYCTPPISPTHRTPKELLKTNTPLTTILEVTVCFT